VPEDDFSNFRSAIDWTPPKEEAKPDDAGFRHISVGLYEAVDNAAHAFVVAGKGESPIEVQFGGYLGGTLRRKLAEVGIALVIDQPRETTKPTVFLTPQFAIGRFRYDFAIVVNGKPAILIECDGKEFHESPEALENDRQKDARAKEVGAIMLRFTGSRIYRDLQSCAEEAIAVLAAPR
jgi:very-short-patch-repair endonuclease